MNIQDLGAIGELLAAIATIATLIYLATQIKQNTNALKSSTRSSWLEAIQTTNQINSSTPENTNVWHRAVFMKEDLSGQDFTLHGIQVSAALNALESLFLEYLEGNVDEQFWESKSKTISFVLDSPSGRAIWDIWNESVLADPRFVEYINAEIIPKLQTQRDTDDA